jgi:hypothetical protein
MQGKDSNQSGQSTRGGIGLAIAGLSCPYHFGRLRSFLVIAQQDIAAPKLTSQISSEYGNTEEITMNTNLVSISANPFVAQWRKPTSAEPIIGERKAAER